MQENECTLVSASCTTGWTDWVHGELWICPNGLLRRSAGLGQTMQHGVGPTVDPTMRTTRAFTPDEITGIAKAGKRNRWVSWESIAAAQAKRGPITDSLHLTLRDGRQLKFLWLRVDQAMSPVAEVVRGHLGERFTGLSEQESN
jgi:hypothetical protein